MPSLTKNQQYAHHWQALNTGFSPWETFGKDVSTYIWPTGGNWLEKDPDQEAVVHSDMLNDAPEMAVKVCGAGYMSGLCSHARRWFELTHADKDLAKWGPVKEWFDSAEKVMYSVYAQSNWYQSAHTGFEEQGVFGSECMLMEEHPTEIVRFYPFTFGEYRWASSWDRKINTIYRKCWMTAEQMVAMFGKNKVSTRVLSAADSKPFSWFKILHIIRPRPISERDPSKIDAVNMPWESVWIEPEESNKQLRVSGFKRFPAIAARWATRGQTAYGFGPGHAVLGRSKLLQEFEKTGLKGLHKMVDPPMLLDTNFKGVLDLSPGAANEGKNIGQQQGARPLYDTNLPLQHLDAKTQNVESRVERAFYNDLFLMIASQTNMNNVKLATQVLEMKEEKMLMLGPSVERQIKEKLEPSIDFVFDVCLDRGLFPPPPDELLDSNIEVEFVSVLAQAQKIQTAQGLRAYIAEVERVAVIDPKTTVKTDLFNYLEEYGETIGVPNKIIRSKEDVEEDLAAIAQAERQQAQMEQQMAMAEGINKLGGAKSDSGTALADLQESMGA